MLSEARELLQRAANGLELALGLIDDANTPRVTLEYLSPSAALRKEADEIDLRDARIRELRNLLGQLRGELNAQ